MPERSPATGGCDFGTAPAPPGSVHRRADPYPAEAFERAWWDGLEDDEVERNLHGNPPYDVHEAAAFILSELRSKRPYNLLDLGCGAGRLTVRLAHILGISLPDPMRPSMIHGVDIAPRMIRRACDRYDEMRREWPVIPVYWYIGDGRTIPSLNVGPLTGAWSVTMFQHIPIDAQLNYIRQVIDHLERGARFVFTISYGTEDTFLSHQVAELGGYLSGVEECGFKVVRVMSDVVVEGWTWITGEKR